MTSGARKVVDDVLTKAVIGSAIEVHRLLGPGLLESAYQDCMCYELAQSGLHYVIQPFLPISYKELIVERAFRPDLIVEGEVIVELKHVEKILAVHEAQLRTYVRLSGLARGLLFNFNVTVLKDGLRRIEVSPSPKLPLLPSPP
jgi:GxxExxY protein